MIITTCNECTFFELRTSNGIGWCKKEGKLCFAASGCSEGEKKI